jgi:ABC-type phosphate/phosphonate transport system substrate-binding protein
MSEGMTSLLSPFSDPIARDLVGHLQQQGRDVRWIDGPWNNRVKSVRDGVATAAWLCGLLHITFQSEGGWPLTAVAAPRSERGGHVGSPVYFGDIVVAQDSPHLRFEDLAGTTFAYNEEGSLSGYWMMLDHLASLGLDLAYFGAKVRSGSHLASLQLVATGAADCAIIDSTLLDAGCPGSEEVRTVTSVGPYPAPPLVVHPGGADALRHAVIAHPGWAPVTDADYHGLRRPH